MNTSYSYYEDLADEISGIQENKVVSRLLVGGSKSKTTLYALDAGQELVEHSVSFPVLLYVIEGSAEVTIGKDEKIAHARTFIHLPAHLSFGVYARTRMLLIYILLEERPG